MAHRVDASFQMLLPDKPVDMASCLADVATAWAAFTVALDHYEAELMFSINESRTKPARGRPRKPRLVTPPEAA